jgi:hypothetical protein
MTKENLISVELKDEMINNSSNNMAGESPSLKLKKSIRNR